MGELEEKETPAATTTTSPQQEVAEEPKETDKMLEKKDDSNADAKPAKVASPGGAAHHPKKPSSPLATSSKTNSPTNDKKKLSSSNVAIDMGVDGVGVGELTNGNGGEEIIDIPNEKADVGDDAATENDKVKISKNEDREVKPKKIPIGGLKLPGFFMKSKPKGAGDGDGDGADGELLEKEHKEEATANAPVDAANNAASDANDKSNNKSKDDKQQRTSLGERLRNFFVRKPAVEKQQQQQQQQQQQTTGKQPNGDADNKSEATAEAAAADSNNENNASGGDGPPSQKRGLLNAIKLPIANIIPRKKAESDVEMGLSKAGLASMETLDDSLKDQDCVDKAPAKNNGTDDLGKMKKSASGEIKDDAAADEKTAQQDQPQPGRSVFGRFCRSYTCSIDDALIALGILLFVLLVAVIGYVLTHETITSPPLREGRYIDAISGCGLVEGLKEENAFAFRGIPYAVPPIGDQRWRPAKPIEGIDDCWNGTLKAHNSGNYCIQMLGDGKVAGDEDCLYLDVVTPFIRYDNPLPVIVLIGAETLSGPSPGILQPSAHFARNQNVVFVRPNFRLGPFGFLALYALTEEAYPHSSGNYALTDIIAALKWIKLNIAHFGGDPKNVVLLGHRAGGTLISALVTSKEVKDLYTRAWVSSSSAIFPGKPLHESEKRNEEYMRALGCADVACLRGASSDQIRFAIPDTWMHFPVNIPTRDEQPNTHHEWLVLDGIILKEHPADAWKRMEQQNDQTLKLIMGTTAHESHTEMLRQRHANWTAEDVRAFIEESKIGALNLTDEAIKRYNATNYRGLVAMITDIRTICPLIINARLQPNVPFYVVTQGHGDDQLAIVDLDMQAILGTGSEQSSSSPSTSTPPPPPPPTAAGHRRFILAMQNLFYYYVAHGAMPQFDTRRRVIKVGEDAIAEEDHPNCDFWISNDIVPRYARVD